MVEEGGLVTVMVLIVPAFAVPRDSGTDGREILTLLLYRETSSKACCMCRIWVTARYVGRGSNTVHRVC